MNCGYCGGLKLVGGRFTRAALPCAYCEPATMEPDMPIYLHEVSPEKPWPSQVMHAQPFSRKKLGFTSWVEPFISGHRLIALVLPSSAVALWTESGSCIRSVHPLDWARDDLLALGRGIRWVGGKEYEVGCAFDCVLVDGSAVYVHSVLPLLSLIDGADHMPFRLRRLELEEGLNESTLSRRTGGSRAERAYPDVNKQHVVQIVPRVKLNTGDPVSERTLATMAEEFGTEKLMVKNGDGCWTGGPSHAWMKWEDEL